MHAMLRQRLEQALGTTLGGASRVGGGSINDAWRVESARGPLFVKHHAHPPRWPDATRGTTDPRRRAFFAAEAEGLARLSVALPVPRVIAVLDDALVLEWLEPGRHTRASEAAAGRALAALHTIRGDAFGLDHDNFMGAVPQDNRPASAPTFAAFFRERRLAPLAHHLPADLRRALTALPLEAHLEEPAAPALIHGDLWGGNLHHGENGAFFIDPATCFGHPEQDLAMTRLFGGFGAAFYGGYAEVSGVVFDAALEERLALLTLWPLLVHVALFGGSYVDQVADLARRFG